MITHIVSDMGGVLIALDWQSQMAKLLGRSLSIEQLHQLAVTASSAVEFETGRTSFDEFAQAFIEEFDLTLSPATVQTEFLAIVQAPLPHCHEVLMALKPHYHLSLLSNTNPAHIGQLRDRHDFFNHFDRCFLSYEVGLMKPSPAIFEHVLTTLGVAPQAVAFFDDGSRNVEAAHRLGIQAYQVECPDEVMAIVQTFDRPR